MQRDIKFRKANKKILYPVPRINPRLVPPGSAQEIHNMKDGLKDKSKNIVQIAFLPEPKEGANGGPRMIMPGKDIPNTTGRRREEERRSNLSINTNTTPNTNNGPTHNGPTQGAQPRHTDRAADRTKNFQDREQQRTKCHKQGTAKSYEHFKFPKFPGSGEQRERSLCSPRSHRTPKSKPMATKC